MKNINYGKVRIWLNRAKANWQFVFYLQVTALTVSEFGWSWWYMPIVILFALTSFYDIERGIRQETEYIFRKNQYFMEMYNKIMGEDMKR